MNYYMSWINSKRMMIFPFWKLHLKHVVERWELYEYEPSLLMLGMGE